MITAIEGYPFDLMTERFLPRQRQRNWKLFIDAFQEFYHAPILHAQPVTGAAPRSADRRLRGAALPARRSAPRS